jgi:hypothetical protein
VLAAVCLAGPAVADEGRSQDYAAGARAAALGGAYGALADDATGVFFNPAGVVDTRTPRVNVSTSLYGLELLGSTPVESDLLRRGVTPADLIFVPSSTGYVQSSGDPLPSGAWQDAFAFSTMVPDYTSRFTEQVPADDDGTRFRSGLTDRRLLAGFAWGTRLGPWLRFGLASHYALRTLDAEESLTSADLGAPGAFIDTSTRLRMSNHALRLAAGLKLFLAPRATVGLTATTPAASVYRDVSFERVVAFSPGATSSPHFDADRVKITGFEFQSDLPGSLRLAFAWSEPASYTFAVDVVGYLPSSYDVLPSTALADVAVARVPVPLHVERGALANVSIGCDVLLSDDVSVAAGAFTNLSGAPALLVDDSGNLRPESSRLSQVHMFGGSLSLGFHSQFSVTRVGLTGSAGAGDIVQPSSPDVRLLDDGPPLRATRETQTLLYLFVATTFRFGEESSARDYSL